MRSGLPSTSSSVKLATNSAMSLDQSSPGAGGELVAREASLRTTEMARNTAGWLTYREGRLDTVQDDTSCRVEEGEVEDTRVWTKKVPNWSKASRLNMI